MAERKTPILLRESPLTRRVMAIHRYTRRTLKNGREVIDSRWDGKQDITHDFIGVALERYCGDDNGLQPLLVRVANGAKLTDEERDRIGEFANRLGDDITLLNELREASE